MAIDAGLPGDALAFGARNQLSVDRHGGRVPAGLWARVLQRLLALNAVIWHNWQIGAPSIRRSGLNARGTKVTIGAHVATGSRQSGR